MREHRHEMLIAFYQCGIATRCLEGREPDWKPVCAHCGKDIGKYAGLVVFERGKPLAMCPEHRDQYQPTEEIIEYYVTPERARKIREQDARMDRWTEELVKNMIKEKDITVSEIWSQT